MLFGFASEFAVFFLNLVHVIFSVFKIENYSKKSAQEITGFTKIPLLFSGAAVFMFGIGFTIMSYVIIDGNLRIFPLAIAVVSYKVSDIFLFKRFRVKLVRLLIKIRNILLNHCKGLVKRIKTYLTRRQKGKIKTKNLLPLDKI